MSSPCCVNPGAKQTHEPVGRVEEIAGIKTYKTGQGKAAIIILTDIFGYTFINARKLADSFSAGAQTTVFIPNYFNTDPMNSADPNLWDLLPEWLSKNPPSDACVIAEKFVTAIKNDFQSIQIIGFCYGAKVVVHLIKHPEFSSMIKAAVVAHPSFLVEEEANQIKRPILFLCADNDALFTSDLRQAFEKELKSNGLGTFIEYPGTTHGFVCRPEDSEHVYKQRDKAVQDAIAYFKKNI